MASELVERLRETHTCDGCGEYVGSQVTDLLDEAAASLASERAAHAETKRERDEFRDIAARKSNQVAGLIKAEAAERLAGARVKATSDELSRYIERCRELSDGGEYSWWSRLAEILSTLTEPAGEAESVAYALIVDGECEEIGWGPFPYDYEDPAVIRLYTTPPKTNSIKKYDWFEES